jgi:AAA domain
MKAIDFDGLNRAACANGRSLVERLIPGGKVHGAEYIVRNPNRADNHPGSFKINYRTGEWADFATTDRGGDFVSLVAFLGNVSQGDAARELAILLKFPLPNGRDVANEAGYPNSRPFDSEEPAIDIESRDEAFFPPRTPPDDNDKPWFIYVGDGQPPVGPDEIRRHLYRRDRVPVRVKIKFKNGSYANWYRVAALNGTVGWQAAKPDGYVDVPYVTFGGNPFDPEVADDCLYWPEGEKDVDTSTRFGFLAFTFGGVGGGLPAGTAECVAGRHVVILADNDDPGRKHAEAKAAAAHGIAASVRIIKFPEKDISDWVTQGHTAEELSAITDAAPLWMPEEHVKSGSVGSVGLSSDDRRSTEPIRFKLVSFDALRVSDTAAYLVKDLIPRKGLVVVWGPPKCGKSFLVFTVMMHVAMGREYRGHRVQQNEVVYLALEGQDGFGSRAEAFRQRYLDQETKVPAFKLCGTSIDLVKDANQLIENIRRQSARPGAVVIDTLNRSLGGSENDPKDMAAYLRAADAIQEAFGCVVIIVHHCGIDDTRPRGHTALPGAVDVQISVKRDGAANIVATVEHAKDMAEGTMIASRLEVVELGLNQDGDPITSCVVVPVEDSAIVKPSKSKRPPKGTQIALRALKEAIDQCGSVPPASNNIPPNTKVVSIDQWRTYAYARGISDGEERAKQIAFKKAHEQAIEDQYVGEWQGQVWPAQAK